MAAGPGAPVDDVDRQGQHVVEAGLGDDRPDRGPGQFHQLGHRAVRDRLVGAAVVTLDRDLIRGLTGDLPVERAGRLQDPHRLVEVDATEVERQTERGEGVRSLRSASGVAPFGIVPGLRIFGHAVSLGRPMPPSSVARAVAVTGAAGFIGSRLVPALAAAGVPRIVGLDMHEPVRTVRGYEHHLVDVAGRELDALLRGCDTVVHLAAVTDPIVDDDLMARVNVDGTRHVLDAAGRVGVRRIVRVSPATVYGAWATNPVPLTEDAPLRPNPGFGPAVHAAEVERLLHEWSREHPEAMVTLLRAAPVLGAGAEHLFARLLAGWRRPRVRGEGAPVQVVHVDDLVTALLRTVTEDHPGVYDVAAAGWLGADEARTLLTRGALPAAPLDVVRRVLARSWRAGLGDVPPAVLPYLVQPWVIATDRLEGIGWAPEHTNEETLLETHDALGAEALTTAKLAAAVGAVVVGAVGGYALRRAARAR